MKTNENKQAIYNFLKELQVENLYVTDYVSIDDIDEYTTFDSLTDLISDNNGFDVEIIYYLTAIKYLMDNDPSLHESLEIALEYGYTTENLNSEVLASLLASKECRESWHGCESEIEDFLNDIDWSL